MKVSIKSRLVRCKKFGCQMLVFFLFALAIIVALSGFTREKAHKTEVHKKSEDVKTENIGCTEEELNPLREGEYTEIDKAVKDYYASLNADKAFIEKYDDLHIYTKRGQYRDTYVIFVEYHMKIKDIYTEVPGLGTLFASRNQADNKYRIGTEKPNGQDQDYVRLLTEHEDVKKLFDRTEEEYYTAVQSDALLREALEDLEKAYSDSVS